MDNVISPATEILVEHGILTPYRKPDKHVISIVTGALTITLADTVWTFAGGNLSALETLQHFLWELYDDEQYREAVYAIKGMYLAGGLPFPETLEAILQTGDTDLFAAYLYEFLMDFEDTISDLKTADADTNN